MQQLTRTSTDIRWQLPLADKQLGAAGHEAVDFLCCVRICMAVSTSMAACCFRAGCEVVCSLLSPLLLLLLLLKLLSLLAAVEGEAAGSCGLACGLASTRTPASLSCVQDWP